MTNQRAPGRAGVAPSLDEVCPNSPSGDNHDWRHIGSLHGWGWPDYAVFDCQLCGLTVYVRDGRTYEKCPVEHTQEPEPLSDGAALAPWYRPIARIVLEDAR